MAITPLRKQTLDGKTYTRAAANELHLAELAGLSRDDLLTRCEIRDRGDALYVPSECLLYFVRACRSDNSERHFERLYKILAERVLRSLPKEESRDGQTGSLAAGKIRDKVFGEFVRLLSEDRQVYSERLDYFEVRFDGALANLRRDARKQVWREEKRVTDLGLDEDTGDLAPEVEAAAGSFNPLDTTEADKEAYRLRMDAAIDSLPPLQQQIVHMLQQGFPIDSKEKGVVSIASALSKAEKTIRNHRDRAYAAIKAALTEEEE